MSDTGDVPALVDVCSGSMEDNEDSDDWDEMEVSGEQTMCLFCKSQFHTIAVALDHCRAEHNFDLLDLKTKYNMDCYSFIKLINYVRLHKPDPKLITESTVALWDDDAYLKPGEMESWLMYDFDDLGSAPSTPHYAIDGKTPISNITYADLQRQIQELTLQLRQKDEILKSAMDDISLMRKVTRTIVESGDSAGNIAPTCVGSVPVEYDTEYFSSYSHFSIHHVMLKDKVRSEGYRDAILNNVNSFRGKTVLDVGCGTGILSMFAAKAEAKKVYGIDESYVVYKAMDIVRENNLHEKIHVIRGRVEDTPLPEDKVDIIVSEWMGYFLLFEAMLDTVIYARDTHLNPGGIILPSRCTMSLIGISDIEQYDSYITFWDNVYGFNMKCMKQDALKAASVEVVSGNAIITTPHLLKEIDLATCTTSTVNFTTPFELTTTKTGKLTALAGYFDTFFDLENPVHFSTGPHATETHWQHIVFYLENLVDVKEGETMKGTLTCNRMKKNVRGLIVTISIGENKYHYKLD